MLHSAGSAVAVVPATCSAAVDSVEHETCGEKGVVGVRGTARPGVWGLAGRVTRVELWAGALGRSVRQRTSTTGAGMATLRGSANPERKPPTQNADAQPAERGPWPRRLPFERLHLMEGWIGRW